MSPENLKAVLSEDSFKSHTRVAAWAKCKGLRTIKSYETADRVGVTTILTDKLTTLASALAANDFTPFMNQPPGKPIEFFTDIPDAAKLATYGTELRTDENGEHFLITYSQANPLSDDTSHIIMAKTEAEINAMGMLREYLGMQVSIDDDLQRGQNYASYDNKTNNYESTKTMKNSWKAVASEMKISGITTVDSWELIHPLSNTTVVGVMTVWRPSFAKFAKDLKRKMEKVYVPKGNNASGGGSAQPSASNVDNFDGRGMPRENSDRDF